MNIELEKKEDYTGLLKVTVEEEDYKKQVNDKIKKYSKEAVIKGFRPGKVPRSLIKQRFGADILQEELQTILQEKINEYIEGENLNIIYGPNPNKDSKEINWKIDKNFEFLYDLGFYGDFEMRPEDISVKQYDIRLSHEKVDEEIESLRDRFAEIEDKEEVNEEANSLFVKFLEADKEDESSVEEKQEDTSEEKQETEENKEGEIEEVTEDESQTQGKMPYFAQLKPANLPAEVQQKITGAKKEDEIAIEDIKALFKDEAEMRQLMYLQEGQESPEGKFMMTISHIEQRKPAEVNEEFYKKVFNNPNNSEEPEEIKTEEEFREKLTAQIKDNYIRESEAHAEREVRQLLIKDTQIELPENFLKDILKEQNADKSEEEFEKGLKDYFDNLRWEIISMKTLKKEEIEIEEEEIVEAAKMEVLQMFYQQQMLNQEVMQNIDTLTQRYLQEDRQFYNRIINRLGSEKAINVLMDQVTIVEEEINVEDFEKLLDTV